MSVSSKLGKFVRFISYIREITVNILFLFIMLIVVFIIVTGTIPQRIEHQTGVLVLDLEGVLVDVTSYDDEVYQLRREIWGIQHDPYRENSIFELTRKIKQATEDPSISGMILKLDGFTGADLPSLAYLGKYLETFKKTDRPIYAVSAQFNQSQYYLASYADEITILPQGSTNLYGFSAQNFYYKSLLDKLDINTNIFRVGTYKSAVEPFIRNDMSNAAKENSSRWLNTMWQNYLNDVAINRGYLPEDIVPPVPEFLSRVKASKGNLVNYALNYHLVDNRQTYAQFSQRMDYLFDGEPMISIYDYKLYPTQMRSFKNDTSEFKHPLVAVLFINGAISIGDSDNQVVDSDKVLSQLAQIENNKNIKALVVRINSPGGSVYASEAIRSALIDLRKNTGMPIVVSMGNMAASGGYWIASAADYIIADPNTITGSIGIFGIIPTFEDTLSSVGIYTDGVSTSPLAGSSVTKALPEEMKQLIQMNIENGYDEFLSIVSDAREMSYHEVDAIAQGQVWIGEDAYRIKLVDKLGDFDDAVVMAAKLANLNEYEIDWQRTTSNFFTTWLSGLSTSLPQSFAEILFNQLPEAKQIKQQLSLLDTLKDPQNRYIYCLNCADVR